MPRNLGVSIGYDGLGAWLCLMLCRIDGKSHKNLNSSSKSACITLINEIQPLSAPLSCTGSLKKSLLRQVIRTSRGVCPITVALISRLLWGTRPFRDHGQ